MPSVKSKKLILAFRLTPYNKNSIAALTGSIEKSKISKKIKLYYFDKKEKLLEAIKFQKKIIVVYSFTSLEFPHIRKEIKTLKEAGDNFTLICGGPHPSGDPNNCLKAGFDTAFIGEGEISLIKYLTNSLEKRKNPKKLLGKRVDINSYPSASRDFPLFTPIEITRGCPHGCRYCQTTYLFGATRHRTIKNILKGVKTTVKKGYSGIRLLTPNGLGYPKLENLLMKIKKTPGVKKIYLGNFPSELWPKDITVQKMKMLKKYVSNQWITIGAQTGSNHLLKKMHRFHTVEDVKKAIRASLKANFSVNIDLIFGLPDETTKHLKETQKLIEFTLRYPKTRIHGHYFLPLPGTPWEKEKVTKIPAKFFKFLKELERKKSLYGDWEKQMKFTLKKL